MPPLPKGKATLGEQQTKADAFGSNEDLSSNHNGHGRSTSNNETPQQIPSGLATISPSLFKLTLYGKKLTAEEVAEDANKYCLIFGIPEAVLTDKGTHFTSLAVSIPKKQQREGIDP